MKKMIEKLYYGELYPCMEFEPKNEEYRNFRSAFGIHVDTFTNQLEAVSPELKEKFIALKDDFYLISSMESEEMYYRSFCLGAVMVIEAVYGINNT